MEKKKNNPVLVTVMHNILRCKRLGLSEREFIMLDSLISGKTIPEIGERFCLTNERVRQILMEASKRLSTIPDKSAEDFEEYHQLKRENEVLKKRVAELNTMPAPIQVKAEVAAIPITECDLSVRAYNCLIWAGIHTIYDLICKPQDEISSLRGMGRNTLREINDLLNEYGLHLGMNNIILV